MDKTRRRGIPKYPFSGNRAFSVVLRRKMKNERATLYLTDSNVILLKPKNGKFFSLRELQKAVGGPIEPIKSSSDNDRLYANEEGMMTGKRWLPRNPHSQMVASLIHYGVSYLTGNLISVYTMPPGLERDDDRMTINEVVG